MKKNKRTIGKIIVVLGIVLIGYACVLFVQNQMQEKQAREYSAEVIEELKEELELIVDSDKESLTSEDPSEGIQDQNIDESSAQGENTILIDDNKYIGILEIPSLNLELPIQSEWSYEKLRNSPCAYAYSPLVIAAHNYEAHFGNLIKLEIGDQACFIDIYNTYNYYEVVDIEELDESDTDKMIDENYDLTLFTCNYNNNTKRVVVRLNKI